MHLATLAALARWAMVVAGCLIACSAVQGFAAPRAVISAAPLAVEPPRCGSRVAQARAGAAPSSHGEASTGDGHPASPRVARGDEGRAASAVSMRRNKTELSTNDLPAALTSAQRVAARLRLRGCAETAPTRASSSTQTARTAQHLASRLPPRGPPAV